MRVIVKGLKKTQRAMKNASGQIMFATSVAENETVKAIQKETGDYLKKKLVIRGTWWKPKRKYGFNIRFSNKRRLGAVLGSTAQWLEFVERGGARISASGRLAIPTLKLRPNVKRKITKRLKPAAIKVKRPPRSTSPAFFLSDPMSGQPGLFAQKRGGGIQRLYTITSKADVKAVLGWEDWAQERAERMYSQEFAKSFARALRTAA